MVFHVLILLSLCRWPSSWAFGDDCRGLGGCCWGGEAITQVQVRVEIEGRDPGQLSRLYLDTDHGWDLFFGWIG